ncbi:hypothetical protein C8J57DRAFT_1232959 [Mycena rebaudengoi]|nr:hypothetical protein C8J57DRAFT_1232959 [Mycena rebaudengoi]
MFSKLSIAVTSVLINAQTLAAATPTARNVVPPVSTPKTLLHCESIVSSASATASAVGAVLWLDLTGLNVDAGLSCSPITVIGNNCGDTEVTCDAPEKEWPLSVYSRPRGSHTKVYMLVPEDKTEDSIPPSTGKIDPATNGNPCGRHDSRKLRPNATAKDAIP